MLFFGMIWFLSLLKGHPAIKGWQLSQQGPIYDELRFVKVRYFWIWTLIMDRTKKIAQLLLLIFSPLLFLGHLQLIFFLSAVITFESVLLFGFSRKALWKMENMSLDFAYNFDTYSNFLNFSFFPLNSVRT